MMPFTNPYNKRTTPPSTGRAQQRHQSPLSPPARFRTVHLENDPACFCDACQLRQELEQPSIPDRVKPVVVSPPREDRVVRARVAGIAGAPAVQAQPEPPFPPQPLNLVHAQRDPPVPPQAHNPVQERILPLSLCVQSRHFGNHGNAEEANSLVRTFSRIPNVNLEPANSHGRRVVHMWSAPNNGAMTNASVANALGELSAMGMNIGGVRTGVDDLFAPVVKSHFMPQLAGIGIHRLSHGGSVAPRDETRDNVRSFLANGKHSFLFCPVNCTDKQLSTVSCKNSEEFYYNEVGFTNPAFWEDSVVLKRTANGSTFSTLEIGAFIPDWTIPEAAAQEHALAMEWLAANGPVFANGQVFYLSLKNEYVTVFIRNMQSPVVRAGRLAGFFPIFAAKNLIIQKTADFGINGHQLTTINLQPRSYLALVGFYKGTKDNLQIITLANGNNDLMVLPNHAT